MLAVLQLITVICYFLPVGCLNTSSSPDLAINEKKSSKMMGLPTYVGADQLDLYVPLLRNARVALLVNQTSRVGDRSLVDVLLENNVRITKIFAPEHGFRGDADAGAELADGIDKATGLPIISIYGKKKAPDSSDLADVDVVIFDIQDVGARFYTYLSTLKYLMEACAVNGKSLLLLDRPNPNGHYIDGPVLEHKFTSFVGVIPIPIVHGMTLGELAWMMNEEGWLKDSMKCRLKIIKCKNYSHSQEYFLPVPPSPNLPNQLAIALYPSLCLFEGTCFSVGRGTNKQFQIYGSPYSSKGDYYFIPKPGPGAASPFLEGKKCRGYDLSSLKLDDVRKEKRINLSYFLNAYKNYPKKPEFFKGNYFIDKLMGTDLFRIQVMSGKSEEEIRASWQPGIEKFKQVRKKYLLYPE
ncbi:MAG: DUF1343 domain-containing protein [Saprospiraceae bacterium]|nr:DUF1343 domain-containing protein [Saprospiraceae bacterium]